MRSSSEPVGVIRTIGPWAVVWTAGFAAMSLGAPVPWLVGPMLVAIALSLNGFKCQPNPTRWLTPVQAVIGTTLGASFSLDGFSGMGKDALPIGISVILILLVSIASGIALSRFSDLDGTTAALGTIPGGAAGMVALSDDLGGETRIVAFMQYARLVIVVITIAGFAQVTGHSDATSIAGLTGTGNTHRWIAAVLATGVAAVGGWLGLRARIPAGALIGPMLLSLVISALDFGTVTWPGGVLATAYLLLGTSVGSRFDVPVLRRIWRLLPQVLGFIIGLSILCAGIGLVLASTTDLDRLTALLATSPGGIDAATIAALETGADVTVVVTVQVSRLLLMVLVGPVIVRHLLRRRIRRVDA